MHVKQKKARDSLRRDERFQRKREEDRDPELRKARLARNIPHTIDRKRVWDDVDEDGLNASVDVQELKRRRMEEAEAALEEPLEEEEVQGDDDDDDADSMLDTDSEAESDEENMKATRHRPRASSNAPSLAPSTTSTNLDLTPSSLALK